MTLTAWMENKESGYPFLQVRRQFPWLAFIRELHLALRVGQV